MSSTKSKYNHSEDCHQYARDVVSGKIPACRFVVLACQRHLDNLARIPDPTWPYTFDEKKANRFCSFTELLPHVKGSQFVGKKFVLSPWQKFIFCNIFGWVKKADGLRRFRKAYVECPKGQGKSAMMSALGLYMTFLDSEPGAEVYSAARTTEQAKIVFATAQQMALKSPQLLEKYGIEVSAHHISLKTDPLSVFRALSSEANNLEGKNPHLCIVDELHVAHRELYENLESAMGKRAQNLLFSITTAGSDRLGICYETRGHLIEILDKLYTDESFFGVIYTLDEETDDWTQEASWIKANPNWGVSVDPESYSADARRAIFTTFKQPSFQTKRLCMWVNADHALISARDWQACYTPGLNIEDFGSTPCVIGVDLSSKLDLCAVVWLFARKEADGKQHLYVFGKYWLPAETIEKSSNPKYESWATDHYLEKAEGATNDFDAIEQELKDAGSKFDVRAISYDPWNAKQLADHMISDGAPMVEMRPLVANFSPALKELLALVAEKRIHHDGNPVLGWAISNLVGHYGPNDSLFPLKERYENKIDPVVAILMALCMIDKAKPKPSFFVVTSK